ncbi:MAG: N-acetylglucosamine-6-phosphate deacetylase [Myxococcales bacterium]|nr:N-acetylglucosamine-6-phosphate deacetylase [Myxococcales bacterium]
MTRICLENATLLDPEGKEARPGGLLIEAGRIAAHLEPGPSPVHDAERIDLTGCFLAPGFIDIHYHGRLVLEPSASQDGAAHDAIRSGADLVRHGTTAYLPTTVAWSREILAQRVDLMTQTLEARHEAGAQPLGLHLEGPWISGAAAGAQPVRGMRSCDLGEARDLLARSRGALRVVTLAPELEGSEALLELLQTEGVVPALGHSVASAACVEAAIERGARHATHLFNAMAPLHHRDAGLVGVALTDARLSADLICDGVHVEARVLRLAARALGERLLLITDRVEADPVGFGSGALHDDGHALRLSDGRLAGSSLTLDRALRNAVELAGLSLLDAVAACTLRPARLLGIEREYGTLRPGARADLVVLDAASNVRQTWVGGRCVHRA